MHTIISGRIGKPVSPVCGIEVVAGLAVGAGVAAAVGAWVGAGVEEDEPLEELVFPPDGAAVVPGVCFGGSVGAVVGGFVGAGAGWLFAFQPTPNGESECTVTANLPSFTCGVSNSTVPFSFKWLIRKSYSSAVVPSGKANRTSINIMQHSTFDIFGVFRVCKSQLRCRGNRPLCVQIDGATCGKGRERCQQHGYCQYTRRQGC